jgi:predicted dehydrogenase
MKRLCLFFLAILIAIALHCGRTIPGAALAADAPLRIGVVGLVHGHVGDFFSRAAHRTDIQLVAIAEADAQVAAKYRTQLGLDAKLFYADLEEMLRKARPQAVVVYTNTYDHRRVVETCARHGVHVMMEKPLAVSADDAHAIQSAARDAKIQVLVNYETTWYPSSRAAYDLVRSNALGEVRKVVVHDGHRGPKEIGVDPEFLSWLTDPALDGGGALFDFGCYGVDLATWLMDGRRPDAVTAVTQTNKPDVYPRVDDEATLVLRYPRAQAIVQASWNWPFSRKDMEVYGETGYAITVRAKQLRVRRAGGEETQVDADAIAAPADDSLSYFRAVVTGRIPPDGPSSLETNVVVTEVLEAARRSAASGATVRLGQ